MQQHTIPNLNPTCAVCPFRLDGTCDGAERPEDLLSWNNVRDLDVGNRPDCTSPAEQIRFYASLARYRLRPVHDLSGVSTLPGFVPVLEAGLPSELRLSADMLYGVGLRTVISEQGRLRYLAKSPARLRKSLRLPRKARLCLSCSCDDDRLENLWERSRRLDTWRKLAALGFEFITGMTFSVWMDNPRFTQRYNIERNLASLDFFGDLGVPVVPILFWTRKADLRQAAHWLRDRPKVGTIGGLAQFHRTDEGFAGFLDDFQRISDIAGREFHVLVIGASTLKRIGRVYSRLPSATIMTNRPIRKGNSGRQLLNDLTYRKCAEPAHLLIRDNIEVFERVRHSVHRGIRPLDLDVSRRTPHPDSHQLILPMFEPRVLVSGVTTGTTKPVDEIVGAFRT